jgi:hypothetical protein
MDISVYMTNICSIYYKRMSFSREHLFNLLQNARIGGHQQHQTMIHHDILHMQQGYRLV